MGIKSLEFAIFQSTFFRRFPLPQDLLGHDVAMLASLFDLVRERMEHNIRFAAAEFG